MKAINTKLADTPENIVKKLKALKKQKLDENNARKTAEDANRVLKKDNKAQKEELETLNNLADNSTKLLEGYRALHAWCEEASKKLSDADINIDDLPEMDATVLAEIEGFTDEPEQLEAATA